MICSVEAIGRWPRYRLAWWNERQFAAWEPIIAWPLNVVYLLCQRAQWHMRTGMGDDGMDVPL